MALTAKFQADFTSFYQAVEKAEVSLKSFETGAGQVEKQLTKMGNSFSGTKVIQEAHLMTRAMLDAGGMAALTDKELKRLGDTVGEASEKMKRLGLEVPPGFQKIADATDNLTAPTKSWTSALSQVSTVISGLLALKIVAWAKEALTATLDYADQLENLSAATSISTGGLQRLESIGASSNVSMETLAKSVETLHRKLDDPAAVSAIERMGLSYEKIRNLKPEDQFLEISKAVAAIEDPVERANTGAELFGKTWDTISPAINEHMQDILKSTVVMSDGTLKALDKAGDAWDNWYLNATRTLKGYLGTLVQAAQESQVSWTQILNPFAIGSTTAGLIRGGVAAQIKNLEELPDRPNAPKSQISPGLAAVSVPDSFLRDSNKQLADIEAGAKAAAKAYEEMAQAMIDLQDETDRAFAGVLLSVNSRTIGNGLGTALGGIRTPSIQGVFGPTGLGANPQGGIFPNAGPAKIGSKTFSTGDNFLGDLASSVPNSILAAIQGGGSKLQAAGSAIGLSIFGKDSSLTKTITGGIQSLFGPNSVLTKTLAASVPIIGSLIGPAVAGIQKLFGKSEESSKVSPLRDEFFKMAGGLEVLNPKVRALTGNLSAVDAIFKAKTVDQYNAALKNLTDILGLQDKALGDLTATAEKYGFTLEELGPALQRQNLDQQAQQLFKDFQILTSGGIDHVAVLTRMADSVNAYVQNAVQMGVEVPEAMRGMLEDMAKQGVLTDAAGNKIEDLTQAGVTFALTMSEGFKSLIDEVHKLTTAISVGLGIAIENIPEPTVTVHARYDTSDLSNAPDLNGFNGGSDAYASRGGVVTAFGIQYFGSGGRVLPFRPRGSDTVPAMLTPGEMVLTARQQQQLLAGQANQELLGEVAGLRQDIARSNRRQPEQIALAVRDALLQAGRRGA